MNEKIDSNWKCSRSGVSTAQAPSPDYETTHTVDYNDVAGKYRVVRARKSLMVIFAQFVSVGRHS